MKKPMSSYIVTILGILLSGGGLFIVRMYIAKLIPEPQGPIRTLVFVCVGIGCGALGYGIANIIDYYIRKDPAAKKQIEIIENDERNVAIANRAKAKAFDLMLFVFGALLIAFALMGVDLVAVLVFVCAYIFVTASNVYYRVKYQKEM